VKVTLGPAAIGSQELVPWLLDLVSPALGTRRERSEVGCILSELIANAIEHGLLGLDSRIKDLPGGFEHYCRLREQGMASLSGARIDVVLRTQDGERPALAITVRDSGAGYRPASVPGGTTERKRHPYGRGLAIVRALTAGLTIARGGAEVSVRYPLRAAS